MSFSQSTAQAGSGLSYSGGPEHLVVGYLRRPHGLRGEALMNIRTDFPERLQSGMEVYVGKNYTPVIIARCRAIPKGMLITFKGVNVRQEIEELCGQNVYVRAEGRPPLPEGEYYHHQLIGLQVIGEDGQVLGELTDILETGANDVYVVRHADGSEILLPAIPAVVLGVDLSHKEMRVSLLPGLI